MKPFNVTAKNAVHEAEKKCGGGNGVQKDGSEKRYKGNRG